VSLSGPTTGFHTKLDLGFWCDTTDPSGLSPPCARVSEKGRSAQKSVSHFELGGSW
jgi:hypothetical protein